VVGWLASRSTTGWSGWLLKRQPKIAEYKDRVRLTWQCTCRGPLSKADCYHDKAKPTDEEVAKTWALKVAELHPQCGPLSKGDQNDPSPAEALHEMDRAVEQVTNEKRALKRQLAVGLEQNTLLERKATKAADAVASQSEVKRQLTRDEKRRVPIDGQLQGGFTPANKSTAMRTPAKGMIDTVKYWAAGSEEKALELVLGLLNHFKLRDRVVARLGLQTNETEVFILEKLRGALRCLRECRSEEQRQQYRLALTLVVPNADDDMSARRVAAVL
jgi:hypothetical protein